MTKMIQYMDGDEVREKLTMAKAVTWMEEAYCLYSNDEAGVFPIITHDFEGKHRNMDIKSGHMDGIDILGVKLLVRVMDNPQKRDLPALSGTVMLVDSKTGQLIGLIDGLSITNIRTGACGAAAAKAFARKDSSEAVVVGAGYQGSVQIRGLIEVMPNLKKVTIVDMEKPRSTELAKQMSVEFPDMKIKGAGNDELPKLLETADILTTCTPSPTPYIKKEWIRPGTHINAIGADMPGKQELDPELVKDSHLFADAKSQVLRLGEYKLAHGENMITEDQITEIGDVLTGKKKGRLNDQEITIFDATGMAIQDLICGSKLLKRK